LFQNRSIRHIQMGIRHMWRVANGLDNAALESLYNTVITLRFKNTVEYNFYVTTLLDR